MSDDRNFTEKPRAPRLLLLLGQSPFDPTSGAAQSTRLIAEALAREGFGVQALATTACEGDLPGGHAAALAELEPGLAIDEAPGIARFVRAGVSYALHSVAPRWKHEWERHIGPAYNAAYQRLLHEWRPDVVLTYGGDPTDLVRRRQARQAGASVVFALHNLAYRKHRQSEVDAFLAPTRFLADAYAGKLPSPVSVLPVPLDPQRVLGDAPEPSAVCFINPEPAKGSLLVAQLADRLGRFRPEITLLIVGGRLPAEALTVAARDLGLNLTRYPNLVQIPPTGRVSEIWNASKVLLMPSVVKEAAGRCALEAMLNGVVPLVSDHGGLPEMVRDAGLRLPPPPELTGRARPVPEEIVDRWWLALTSCYDRTTDFALRSATCRQLASAHTLENIAPLYASWFRQQLTGGRPAPLA